MPTSHHPELEIALHREQSGGLQVELRFSDPDSAAERAPLRAPCRLDPESLLPLGLDPGRYGRALSDQVLSDPRTRRFLGEVGAAIAQGDRPLRLRLSVGPGNPDLEALRWELLCDPDTGHPYATSERVLFSRFLHSGDWRPLRPRPRAELTALVAVAAPSNLADYGLAEVDLPGEIERARGALGAIAPRILGQGQPLTLDALTDALRPGVDILYLVAHGALDRDRGPVLFLQDETGQVRRERGDDLARRVGELRDPPRLVVLASCEGAAIAAGGTEMPTATDPASPRPPDRHTRAQAALAPRLAAAGVPAILAMQGRVSMATVATLMPRFFQELVQDGQIDRALAVARGLVRDRPDAWMPALFLRLRGGRLWDASAAGGHRRWPRAALAATLGILALGGAWWAIQPIPDTTRPLAGTILGADGEPLADVAVHLPGAGLETRTDALGRFDLPVPAAAGETLTLVARHPDHRTLERYPAAGTRGLTYRLAPKGSHTEEKP